MIPDFDLVNQSVLLHIHFFNYNDCILIINMIFTNRLIEEVVIRVIDYKVMVSCVRNEASSQR